MNFYPFLVERCFITVEFLHATKASAEPDSQ